MRKVSRATRTLPVRHSWLRLNAALQNCVLPRLLCRYRCPFRCPFRCRGSHEDRRWFFRIVAKNGEIIAQSEAYVRRIDAIDTARLILSQGKTATISVHADE